MVPRKADWPFLLVCITFLLMVSLPYLAAEWAGGEDYVFAGLLQNPVDGNSYLAKMYQGWLGEWTFTLPYTDQPGEGTYLFLFYLFLGHLARISGLPTVLVFHLARLGSAVFMLYALWRFFGATLPKEGVRRLAFLIAGLGSGLGWLAALAGAFTADFWLAEAYPFLSAYANPHFPLGLGLMLVLLAPAQHKQQTGWLYSQTSFWLAGLALGIVMPFGVIVCVLVLSVGMIFEEAASPGSQIAEAFPNSLPQSGVSPFLSTLVGRLHGGSQNYQQLFGLLASGVPVLAYDYWVASTHPVLTVWNAQNLTPAPHLWDTFLSLSPVLWLSLAGGWAAWQSGERGSRRLLAWAVMGLLLLYMPFSLQRRFLIGLYVPLAGLAALGIGQLSRGMRKRRAFLAAAWISLALPTNWMILLVAAHGIASHANPLYLEIKERQALEWVQANTAQDAVILASPETSLWIPAQTGRRVVAGHPFETVDAEVRAEQVLAIFRGAPGAQSPSWLAGVDFVWVGVRERSLGGNLPAGQWLNVYGPAGVTIWARAP